MRQKTGKTGKLGQIVRVGLVLATLQFLSACLQAQSEATEQLVLDIQKLAQLKEILGDMKQGYQILYSGYESVRQVSEGSFHLHQNFLDGLLAVSPSVREYPRITDIMNDQLEIVKEYQTAYSQFSQDPDFNNGEVAYLEKVYGNLVNRSVNSQDELAKVIEVDTLRMSDGERLNAIDRVYQEVQDQLSFLRNFDHETTILALQRARDRNDYTTLQTIYGIKGQ